MIRKALGWIGIVCVAVITVLFLSDITRKDVIAANVATLQNAPEPLTAGDIVMVSPDGKMSRICNAVITTGGIENDSRSELYFNRVMRVLVSGVEMAEGLGILPEGQTKKLLLRKDLPFIGEASSLMGSDYSYANPKDCECAIARTLSKGHKACNVSASLIETREVVRVQGGDRTFRPVRRSVAVNLSRHVMHASESSFEQCGVAYTDIAKVTMQALCSDDDSLPLDVRLRKIFNLIDSEPYHLASAAKN